MQAVPVPPAVNSRTNTTAHQRAAFQNPRARVPVGLTTSPPHCTPVMPIVEPLTDRRSVAVLLALGTIIAVTAAIVPLMQDDLCRITVGSGLADAVERTLREYQSWTGRIGPVFSTSLVVNDVLPRWLYALATGLAGVALVATLERIHENRTQPGHTVWNTVAAVVIVTATPQAFGYSVFFVTGAIQYLWSTLFAVLYLWPFKSWLFGQSLPRRPLLWVGHGVAGVLLGLWMEHVAAALVGLGIAALAWGVVRRHPPPWILVINHALLAAAAAVLILAPGNYSRLDLNEDSRSLVELFFSLNHSYFTGVAIKYLVIVAVVQVIQRRATGRFAPAPAWRAAGFYTVISYATAMTMLGAGYGAVSFSRAFFSEIVAVIAVLQLIPPINWPANRRAIILLCLLGAVLLVSQQTFYWTLWAQEQDRQQIIADARANQSTDDIVVPPYQWFGLFRPATVNQFSGGPFDATDIHPDASLGHNQCAARAYEIGAIRTGTSDLD